jgi:hypothetical protein
MFGWKRQPKPVALVPFADAPPRLFNTILCDGVTAHNLPSFAELRALHARLQADRPGQRVLASLDDLGQAAYTSGHGTEVHRLDDVEADDPADGIPPNPGDLSTPADFPNRLANLLRGAVELEAVRGLLLWETSGDANDPITINRDPDAVLRIAEEREAIFQFVPVASAADAITAFPNGYFHGDLNPFQTHALARHLEVEHGLDLFGTGSRFLAFRRNLPLSEGEAQRLAVALCGLYADTPEAVVGEFAALLTGRDWLLLRYTES